jgi:hypothetical protein
MFPNNAVVNVLKMFQTDIELRNCVSYFADLSEAFDHKSLLLIAGRKVIVCENGRGLYLWWNDACL